jgi:hypothetical protein
MVSDAAGPGQAGLWKKLRKIPFRFFAIYATLIKRNTASCYPIF